MVKKMRKFMMTASAATFIGMVSGVESAFAQATFSTIVTNMSNSIMTIPGLISGISYMMGILLGVLGILKIKDHVENPGQHPLQQGAVRLAAGGALFALPIIYEAMRTTIGTNRATVIAPGVKALKLEVEP